MAQLYFKKVFQDAIRQGRKTTTLRRWPQCRIHGGDRVFAPGLGWLQVGKVEVVDFDLLGETDARADGFDSLAELTKAVREIYPDYQSDGKQWYRVCFEWDGKGIIAKGKQRRKLKKKTGVVRRATPRMKAIDHKKKSRLAKRLRRQLDTALQACRLATTS